MCLYVTRAEQQGGISEREPIITYRETLKVINDWRKLLQVENINE